MIFKVIGAISFLLALFFIISCESESSIEFKRYYSVGAQVYQNHCQNCHGANGQGLAALIPPLDDSLFLKTNRSLLACYIKSGLKGPIKINGKDFDDGMPANDLSPMELAQALTYVCNSFGNKLNTINQEQVETNLRNCK
ncbi:MAG: c-type cytochrome [Sphingobacteriales bacterium]